MKQYLLTSLFLASAALGWAVPAQINYQGRLTDANGDPVTGEVSMSLKMFDAATAGNELYSEDIGTVTLDDNGVYSFSFGADGQGVVDVEEEIAVTDGSKTSFTSTLGSTPLDGTLVVEDGTYSWNAVDGNPGVQATGSAILAGGFVVGINITNAGEGYVDAPTIAIEGDGSGASATAVVENGAIIAIAINNPGSGYTNATVTIEQYPTPYVVDYSEGTVSAIYETAPAAGTEIMASYDTLDSSIVGALSASASHWLELSVDGDAQTPRERILSVPFAQVAGVSEQAAGELAEAVASLSRNPDLPVVTERGIHRQGEANIAIPAGYRMRILTIGSETTTYPAIVKLIGLGYINRDFMNSGSELYLDGPLEATAYSSRNGWFSYEIKKVSLGE